MSRASISEVSAGGGEGSGARSMALSVMQFTDAVGGVRAAKRREGSG